MASKEDLQWPSDHVGEGSDMSLWKLFLAFADEIILGLVFAYLLYMYVF